MRRTGGRSGRRRTHCPPAAGLLTWLPSSATAADEDASLRITVCQRAAMSTAITCTVVATLRHSGQRALIDEDVTDDMLGQRWIAASQQRLPVQPSGVTAVKAGVPGASRAGRGKGANRAGLTRSQHRKLRASRRRRSQQAPSATEVRSGNPTLPRARLRTRSWPRHRPGPGAGQHGRLDEVARFLLLTACR